mmetsp:Transcript_14696/g.46120  ORF Transcript_14696/g.46120 Transcript_14696/m.46120 type:complete len:215 (-) Transcript_14696:981-1625(-)
MLRLVHLFEAPLERHPVPLFLSVPHEQRHHSPTVGKVVAPAHHARLGCRHLPLLRVIKVASRLLLRVHEAAHTLHAVLVVHAALLLVSEHLSSLDDQLKLFGRTRIALVLVWMSADFGNAREARHLSVRIGRVCPNQLVVVLVVVQGAALAKATGARRKLRVRRVRLQHGTRNLQLHHPRAVLRPLEAASFPPSTALLQRLVTRLPVGHFRRQL